MKTWEYLLYKVIPNVIQNLTFLAARKSPEIEDRKLVSINQFAIFDPRGFGALEMLTFELRSVGFILERSLFLFNLETHLTQRDRPWGFGSAEIQLSCAR